MERSRSGPSFWLHGPIVLTLPDPPLTDPDAGVGLRAWGRPGDADALAAAWSDPEVARWTAVPEDRSVAAAARWISGEAARRESGVALDLVLHLLDRPDGVLGEVGLVVVDAERGVAEVGWWLAPTARGSGLAAAAVRCLTRWALGELGMRRLLARTHPDNPTAGRVAARSGWRRAGDLAEGRVLWVADRTPGGTP